MTLSELRRGLIMAREHEVLARSYEGHIRGMLHEARRLHEDDLTNMQTFAEGAYWERRIANEIRYTLRQVHHVV